MRKLFLVAVVAASLLMIDSGDVSAFGHHGCGGGGGCGGRHHRHRHHGGCGGGCAASCGSCAASACDGGPACAMAGDGTPTGYAANVVDEGSATIVVELPADATLRVDDTVTTSTSSNRVFVTPPLPSDQSYQYTLTAQVMQGGVLQTVTRQVTVRAGEETHVNLEVPGATVASR